MLTVKMQDQNEICSLSDKITLVHSGADFFEQLEKLILNCRYELHIQTYIFSYDSIGRKITEALLAAAARNVQIFLLADGYGSSSLPKKVIEKLKSTGIKFRHFSPLFSVNTFHIGRRLHHKVAVADANSILIGGINIADKYCGTSTETPWLDYAVLFNNKTLGKHLQELCRAIYSRKWHLASARFKTFLPDYEATKICILQNDWLKRKKEIHSAYIKNIKKAKEEIIIVGSYFLPGKKLINALESAAENKVKIKLILSGLTDVPLAKRAISYFYSKLLRHNIEIYEWDKSVLHGKTAVIDRKWTTIGSFNLNNLSSYASIEMNVSIESNSFAEDFLTKLSLIISECQQITPETLKIKTSWRGKLLNWFSFWAARIILSIATYLPYKRFLKVS